jgi:hypothetical protein
MTKLCKELRSATPNRIAPETPRPRSYLRNNCDAQQTQSSWSVHPCSEGGLEPLFFCRRRLDGASEDPRYDDHRSTYRRLSKFRDVLPYDM